MEGCPKEYDDPERPISTSKVTCQEVISACRPITPQRTFRMPCVERGRGETSGTDEWGLTSTKQTIHRKTSGIFSTVIQMIIYFSGDTDGGGNSAAQRNLTLFRSILNKKAMSPIASTIDSFLFHSRENHL
jgi:hypothetical protein